MQTPSDDTAASSWQATLAAKPQSVFGNFDASQAGTQTAVVETSDVARSASTLTLQEQIDITMARAFIYRLLAKAFEEPDVAGWAWLCQQQTATSLRLAAQVIDASPLHEAVESFLQKFHGGTFDAFHSEYVFAFGHTARGECPLNEAEYGDIKADPLFQPHRLADLGAFYTAFGMEIAEDAAERQDHIAIELEFMSVLAAKEAYAVEHQLYEDQLAICRDAEKMFVREHLARWIPGFTRRLERMAGDGPLSAIAVLMRTFLFTECDRFGVLPGSDDLVLRPVSDDSERLCDSCGINNLPPGATQAV